MAFDRATYEQDSRDLALAKENYRRAESELARALAWLNDAEWRVNNHWRERMREQSPTPAAKREE